MAFSRSDDIRSFLHDHRRDVSGNFQKGSDWAAMGKVGAVNIGVTAGGSVAGGKEATAAFW